MTMKTNIWHAIQRKARTRERIMSILLEELKDFQETQGLKGNFHILNVLPITRWATLQQTVPLKKNSSRR